MNYRSSNKSFLKELKDYIFQYDETPDYSWSFFYRYLFIDDLYQYSREIFKGQEVERGIGNLNSKIVVLVESLELKEQIDLLKLVLGKAGIDFNMVYFTSYMKAHQGTEQQFDEIINLELKAIKPGIILTLGEYNLIGIEGCKTLEIKKDVVCNILKLQKDDPENPDLMTYKKELWSTVKHLIRYTD